MLMPENMIVLGLKTGQHRDVQFNVITFYKGEIPMLRH